MDGDGSKGWKKEEAVKGRRRAEGGYKGDHRTGWRAPWAANEDARGIRNGWW